MFEGFARISIGFSFHGNPSFSKANMIYDFHFGIFGKPSQLPPVTICGILVDGLDCAEMFLPILRGVISNFTMGI